MLCNTDTRWANILDLLRVLEDRDNLGLRVAELEDELKMMKPT